MKSIPSKAKNVKKDKRRKAKVNFRYTFMALIETQQATSHCVEIVNTAFKTDDTCIVALITGTPMYKYELKKHIHNAVDKWIEVLEENGYKFKD